MIQKILLAGIIFFVSSSCLSSVGAQNVFKLYDPKEEKLYPFTLRPLETLPHTEGRGSPIERASSCTLPDREIQPIDTLLLPVRDESYFDFSVDILFTLPYKEEPKFDIPIVFNAKVQQFIQYFQTAGRERFVTYLARSERYIPFMRNLLKEYGLPEDLVYMALIESGFDPHAYSRSKASGPWQFTYLTGKRYGLKVNWWVDERKDPEKSTIAAAKYLKDLYDMFESWHLAAAGYNAGEYKIARAVRRFRTEDFWLLANYQYLKRETKNYVPQMIAAAVIAKNPEKYGFTGIEYQEPLRYEKVKVPELSGLSLVAKACEASLDEIKDLNPEILRAVTPPNEPEYEVKIPYGKKKAFLRNFEALRPLDNFEFKNHLAKTGETLPGIAGLYRVDLEPMLQINQLKKTSRISKGMTLLIPIAKDEVIKPLLVAQKKNGKPRQTRSLR